MPYAVRGSLQDGAHWCVFGGIRGEEGDVEGSLSDGAHRCVEEAVLDKWV